MLTATTRILIAGTLIVLAAAAASPSSAEEDGPQTFDHFRTSFPLVDAHERVNCEQCHRGGQFEGTPTRCVLCHDGSGFRAQTSQDVGHIRSTQDCDDCHLSNAWVPSRIDHGSVRGSCFACHNDVNAMGKNPGHIVTSNDCERCHVTSRWTGAGFDHFGITAPCISCHNNMNQPGKPGGHIASSDDCELCHNTRDWRDATFDHSTITASCSSCHLVDLPVPHFMTMDDCSECHRTTGWAPDIFMHSTPNYPGTHAGNLACTDCHQNNSPIVIWPQPAYQPDCAACHESDFAKKRHEDKRNGQIYTVSELRDCASACHFDENNRPKHRVGDGGW